MSLTSGYKIVQLANGTHSVHSLAHRETFHPVIGPVAEAEALYVKQLKLPDRLRQHEGEFVIWDVGLGAAANALTVLRATRELPCRLRLVSFDHTLEPLQFALEHAEQLGYFGGYEQAVTELLHSHRARHTDGPQIADWEVHLGDFPTLMNSLAAVSIRAGKPAEPRSNLVGADVRRLASDWEVDTRNTELAGPLPAPHAILFDAFSPAKNPAMWTQTLFTNLYRLLDPNRPCALPTYSRSTMLRVSLLLAGFYVGGGHATGEKEETTLAANTLTFVSEPLDRKWLRRARNSTSAEPLWEPHYRQAPLSDETWERLQRHPQFR
jgi:tRNA U34 5-methylaminomethyl-2-thiouridine-forming methyltransferase MnmC